MLSHTVDQRWRFRLAAVSASAKGSSSDQLSGAGEGAAAVMTFDLTSLGTKRCLRGFDVSALARRWPRMAKASVDSCQLRMLPPPTTPPRVRPCESASVALHEGGWERNKRVRHSAMQSAPGWSFDGGGDVTAPRMPPICAAVMHPLPDGSAARLPQALTSFRIR